MLRVRLFVKANYAKYGWPVIAGDYSPPLGDRMRGL